MTEKSNLQQDKLDQAQPSQGRSNKGRAPVSLFARINKEAQSIKLKNTDDNFPKASLEDYKALMAGSSARISLFEFIPPIPTTLSREQLLEAVWATPSRCLEANTTFCQAYRLASAREAIGQSLGSFITKDESNLELFQHWIDNGFFVARLSCPSNNSLGHPITLQTAIYSTIINGAISKIWIVSRDITDLTNAISAIKREEEHYRTMVERPGLVLVRSKPDGSYIYISPHVQDTTGYSPLEFFNDPTLFPSLLHPDDKAKHEPINIGRRNRTKKPVEAEYRVKCRDGEYHWFFERMIPKFDRYGEVESYDSLAFDIQERKQLEQELMHAQKMEMFGTLAGGIAHDFNNHLTAILGQITLTINDLPVNHPCQQQLHAAEQATLGCAEMTRHLLMLGRKTEFKRDILDANSVIDLTLHLLKHVLPSTIEILTELSPDLNKISGNLSQLQQIIINLAVNSRDAMPNGGKLTFKSSAIELTANRPASFFPGLKPGKYIQIAVEDSGAGIPATVLPHIFEPFFTTKAPGKGTGLGLSSVYSLVKAHNGGIHVESTVGIGTSFAVAIPEAQDAQQLMTQVTESRTLACGDETILVADDDNLVRSLIKTALEMRGYKVITATDGEDALAKYKQFQNNIALAFIDYTMPKLSGHELATKLHFINSNLKVILSSGYNEDKTYKGSGPFLAKPFTIPDLCAIVRATLDQPVDSDNITY